MVKVTLVGKANRELYINPHHIEYVEQEGDLIITFLSGKRLLIQESFETLYKRIIQYRRRIGVFKNEE